MKTPRRMLAAAATAIALAAGGCGTGQSATSSMVEGTVTGRVTIQGRPAGAGTVHFNPANSARKDAPRRSAEIGKDGRYAIQTLVGGNSVSVVIPNLGRAGDLRRAARSIDVARGENTCDIDIPPMVAPPGFH